MIFVHHISKKFNKKNVITDMNFAIPRGKIVGLVGPNGSGKTTLIRIINGVILPSSGEIKTTFGSLANLRTKAGIVTESAGLYLNMTAIENLIFYSDIYEVNDLERASTLLERFGLMEFKDSLVSTFSTGMKKRLALAKSLLHRPDILFLDEPTNGLDPDGIQEVLKMIKEINRSENTTIVICSHLLSQLESVCDEYIFIDAGKKIASGTLEELKSLHPQKIKVRIRANVTPTNLGRLYGFNASIIDRENILVEFDTEEDIPILLKKLFEEKYKVYECVITSYTLEEIYFGLRGKVYE